ncbi:hypothetical protein AY599_21860 [Leptolyngbya valderiana BDU 20041]|nr:hypothetical protein AY599_21860 [Leptolyngbya valderiana BDU 20041]
MKLTLQRVLTVSLSCLAALSLWTWGGAASAVPSASQLFRDAYNNRYTWNADFPGYSATVLVTAGEESERGTVLVEPDLNVSVYDIEDADLRNFIKGQLQMEVIHRRRLPFEEIHGDDLFDLEGIDNTGAAIVREIGDESNSFYRVKDGIIAQVNRTLEGVKVTVDTLETEKTPEGIVVTQFQTKFRDPTLGTILEQERVNDRYTRFSGYYVLAERSIEQVPEATLNEFAMPNVSLRFENIQSVR